MKKQARQGILKMHNDASSAQSAPSSKGHLFSVPLMHLLLICLLGFAVYSNTFHVPFQWDEEFFIVHNPAMRDIGFFFDFSRAKGVMDDAILSRYVGYLSFAINHSLHGSDVTGYHIVNLSIHIINAFLVYFLLVLTLRTPFFGGRGAGFAGKPSYGNLQDGALLFRYLPLAVALFFTVHPIQTEAVTYIFQRLASLVSMFYLLSLVLYVKGRLISQSTVRNAPQRTLSLALTYYFLSLLSAVAAMKTKENAFTLPVMITIYEFLFFAGPLKSRIVRLVPFLLTMVIIPMMFIGSETSPGEFIGNVKDPESLELPMISRRAYLFTQFPVIMTYLRLLFFPVHQNLIYDYPLYRSFFTPSVLLSFILLLSIFSAGLYLCYASRLITKSKAQLADNSTISPSNLSPLNYDLFPYYSLTGFGIIWFFVALSIESSIIPIPQLINEYRVYLPSVGFFIAVTTGGMLLMKKILTVSLRNLTIVSLLFVMIVLMLSSATYMRNAVWDDKVSLWEDVVRKSPDSWSALNNLGRAYNETGRQRKAIEIFERSIKINPFSPITYSNLGVAYARLGRTDEAITYFLKAIDLNPNSSSVHTNIARAYADKGLIEKAAHHFRRAAELNPYSSRAYHGLGTALVILGRSDDALVAYTKFVHLRPKDPEAYKSRGLLYANKGEMAKAMSDFQMSCDLGSNQGCAYLEKARREIR